MIQELARKLQIKKHHDTKELHKRMLTRTFTYEGKEVGRFEVIDNRKITPDMKYN